MYSKTLSFLHRVLASRSRDAAAAVMGRSSVQGYCTTLKTGPGGVARTRVVDLRSEVVAKLAPAIRKAMLEAEVEYDLMGEDPTARGDKSFFFVCLLLTPKMYKAKMET